ncbi:MAG: choice-of-anchor A family protein [Cyanobacteria bacterium P01_A01_bin.105]
MKLSTLLRLSTRSRLLAGTAALATVGWAAPTLAFSLGSASGYNVFVLGDYDMQSTDVEGKLAVGGSLTADTFGIGSKLRGEGHGTALVVGNDVTLSNGKVYGDAMYGGSATVAADVGFEFLNDDDSPIRRASLMPGSSLDFSAIDAELKAIAQTVSQDAASALGRVVTEQFGDVTLATLTGSDPDSNVFNLAGDLFSSLRKLTFEVPEAAEIIVNVSGAAATVSDFGFYFGEQDCNRPGIHMACRDRSHNILFNFADAELLDITRVGFMGSILAPHAAVDFNNGHINGTLVAGSLAGTGESHLIDTPDHPTDPSQEVPEPAVVGGLVVLGLGLRRMKRVRG